MWAALSTVEQQRRVPRAGAGRDARGHDRPQQRCPAHPHMQDSCQTGPGPAACEGNCNDRQDTARGRSPSPVPERQTRDLLNERTTPAQGVIAVQPPHGQCDHHRLVTDRSVGQPAFVAAVHMTRRKPADLNCGNSTPMRSSHRPTVPDDATSPWQNAGDRPHGMCARTDFGSRLPVSGPVNVDAKRSRSCVQKTSIAKRRQTCTRANCSRMTCSSLTLAWRKAITGRSPARRSPMARSGSPASV